MILHPDILALFVSSILISLMALYAACNGFYILRHWDIHSGSEMQLLLERRTSLISTLVGYFLFFQLASLFLFIRTADGISPLFVGAMCAAGTFAVNSHGYPALFFKILSSVLAGVWLIVNHADNQGYDYPLIRVKYLLLLITAPCILAETVLQILFLSGLQPDIITSCCGALFSQSAGNIAAEIISAPGFMVEILFYFCMAATCTAGIWFYLKGKGGYVFSGLSAGALPVSIAAILAFISLYIYELPSHHCPFCIIQKEYGYIGYPLYLALLSGTVTGISVSLLQPHRAKKSLVNIIPGLQKKLAAVSVISFLLFLVIVSWQIWFSALER